MKFSRPIDALMFWYDVLRNGGVPLPLEEYDDMYGTRPPPSKKHGGCKAWTPSNSLCAYLDIGKAIARLSLPDQVTIKEYLLQVVGYNGTKPLPFQGWQRKNQWRVVMRRLWHQIPRGYKHDNGKGVSRRSE